MPRLAKPAGLKVQGYGLHLQPHYRDQILGVAHGTGFDSVREWVEYHIERDARKLLREEKNRDDNTDGGSKPSRLDEVRT